MLYYALIFLVIALIAGALGIWALAGIAATAAKTLFSCFWCSSSLGFLADEGPSDGDAKNRPHSFAPLALTMSGRTARTFVAQR